MLKKTKNLILPAFIICFFAFNYLEAEIWIDNSYGSLENYENIIPEHETLLYQAQLLSSKKKPKDPEKPVQQTNINDLVKNAVNVCFNAYQSTYQQAIAQERERLIAMNAGNSSYYNLIPSVYAKKFAATIIDQINVLTQPLSYNDKQLFWNIASSEIKKVLNDFCNANNGTISDLNEHIDSLINMKKTFG